MGKEFHRNASVINNGVIFNSAAICHHLFS